MEEGLLNHYVIRILSIFAIVVLAAHNIESNPTFYCKQSTNVNIIINETDTVVLRTVYEGRSNYDNDMICYWLLDAGADDRRLQITVKDSHLQWAPESAICQGLDFMTISDGHDDTGNEIVAWCGDRNPYFIESSGRYLYLQFYTNDRNTYTYRGITLEIQSYDASPTGICPFGWMVYPNKTDQSCYVIREEKTIWDTAQQYCNYVQANLVSFDTEEEAQFITDYVKGIGYTDQYWISLNDIENEGQYNWLDRMPVSISPRWRNDPHNPDKYLNCATMKGDDGLWQEQFCTDSKVETVTTFRFICEKKKFGNKTILHPIPERETGIEEKGKPTAPGVYVAIGAGVAALLIVLVAGLLIRHYCFIKPSETQQETRQMGPVGYRTPGEDLPPSYSEVISGGANKTGASV